MKLNDKLKMLDSYPFHMPGHKRNRKWNIIGSEIDITEIDGFDNLHNPETILYELQAETADLFGYKKSMISVNGSTCCILSAICAVCSRGDKIIIARNCHKSVYNACFLNELDVVYIEPEFEERLAAYTKIQQDTVDEALKNNPDAKALVITSPTYEGFISEINCDIPLIIDSAHGAHFGFAEWLPKRPNGDIIIQSLHKTLPCLTQTAVMHINNEKYYDRIKMYMDIFESSSPSYILLNSVDLCIDFLKNSKRKFKAYKKLLDDFISKADKLENIEIYKNDDRTRFIISARGYTGRELAAHFRQYKIEPEAAMLNYVILISTIGDTAEGFEMLYNALKEIKIRNDSKFNSNKIPIPKKGKKASEIIETQIINFEDCIGQICGEYIFAYPPGIPIIVPGEIISEDVFKSIKLSIKNGINIISDSNLLPHSILTKAE